ncbi:MAG: type IV pilus assembly protein PilM [Verrucomicrobia bacterium]|jgi:type IV pilus assembly protein PilM|nr:type IV pilus assembly protein PilM [Verrucomicrobiota bacterium]
MLGSKSFLCIDFGAGTLKLAEFDVNEAGSLRLLRYALRPLGLAGAQEAARDGVVQRAMQELIASKTFTAKSCSVCAAGFQVFSKFLKLPPVDSSKITQIITYEAQQNVPFPLEEVVWDYQILGTMPSGELEVLLVALKSDIVEKLFKATEGNGLRLDLVDASPAALCNAFRYNYGDLEGCSLLLDIGAKTSNVLIFEKGKVFCRSINIGANSITQDFAAEVKMPFVEAEKFKISDGFVSLGGAYEDPDNPKQAAISKIARQVMTRLHIQVNQTIQFYRSQQGGSAPQRVFLAGGASIMPYTAQFFAEKLNVPVDYFNPFRNIQIDPSVNVEELAKVAHALGEVVGIGLRTPAQCPVELNLIPKAILKRQQLNQKKPYFVAAALSLILVVFMMGLFYDKLAQVKQAAIENRQGQVTDWQNKEQRFNAALAARKQAQSVVDQYTEWAGGRYVWPDMLAELRAALTTAEQTIREGLNIRASVWVEKMAPEGQQTAEEATEEEAAPRPRMDLAMMMRYGLLNPEQMKALQNVGSGGGGADASADAGTDGEPAPRPKTPANTNTIHTLNLTCRAISLKNFSPAAESLLMDTLEKELKNSPHFLGGTNGTRLSGQREYDENTGTFRFEVKLKLAQPIPL